MENEFGIPAEPKRQRGSNYTAEEKTLLMTLIFQEKHILECKKTDAITWRQKDESWKRITDSFNAKSPGQTYRNINSLKKLYDNQKKQIRKEVSKERASYRRTGGGNGYFLKDPAADLTLAVMNEKTVVGLENMFDSDAGTSNHSVENHTDTDNNKENESTEYEQIVLQVEEVPEASCQDSNLQNPTWGTYTPSMLKTPTNKKLIPPSASAATTVDSGSSQSWTARRRPMSSALSSSNITQQYSELSKIKLEIARLELQTLQASVPTKEARERIEFELRRESLELDIQIKKVMLEKIKSLPATDIVTSLCTQLFQKP